MQRDQLKTEVTHLDRRIFELVEQRYRLLQTAESDDVLNTLDAWRQEVSGTLTSPALEAIYREILSGQQAVLRPLSISYLGPAGTFTHQATLAHFGHAVQSASRQTVADVFEAVEKGHSDYGVVPVENSTEGAVTDTYDLFYDHNVVICAEIHLHIHHHLVSRSPLDRIETVYSHPQVFGQCRHWIRQTLGDCALVEVSSTSAAAGKAAAEPRSGALASLLAAEQYGLQVLCPNVEDLSENITRFLVLGKSPAAATGDDKTSIMLAVQDRVGALYDALLPFKENRINLTLIHSRPSKRKSWDYYFFIDFLGHVEDEASQKTLAELSKYCKFVKHLGSYPRHADAIPA
jgi:chorismate mutase / prephenate dehydratase